MTALSSRGWAETSVPERRAARMVLDVKFALDGLPTEPAPRMTTADPVRLQRLVAEVDHELHEHV